MERFSLRILVLSFIVTANLGYSNHGDTGTDSGTSRPKEAKADADNSYQQLKKFDPKGVSITLSSGQKVKLDEADASKFKEAINKLEEAEKSVAAECKSKAGGKELTTLLKEFANSLAQEVSKATRNTKAGGLVNDQGDKKNTFNAQLPGAAAAGIEKIVEAQQEAAKGEDAAKVKSQSKSLLGFVNNVMNFFTGGKADESKPKDLAEVKPDGSKASKSEDSVKHLVDGVKKDADVCIFDKSSSPRNSDPKPTEEAPVAPPAQTVASNTPTPKSDNDMAGLLSGLNGLNGKDGKKEKEEKPSESTPSATPPIIPTSSPSGKSSQPPQGGGSPNSGGGQQGGGKDDGKGQQQQPQMPQMPPQGQQKQMPMMPPSDSSSQAPISQNESQPQQNNAQTSDKNSSEQPNLNTNANQQSTIPAGGPGAITPTGPGGVPMAGYVAGAAPYGVSSMAPMGQPMGPGGAVQQMAPPQISNFPR